MLYRHPGTHYIHDDHYDYVVVPEEAAGAKLLEGWSLTLGEARERSRKAQEAAKAAPAPVAESAAPDADDAAPPTRAELEEQCRKLGLKVDGRYSDKRLLTMIQDAMR